MSQGTYLFKKRIIKARSYMLLLVTTTTSFNLRGLCYIIEGKYILVGHKSMKNSLDLRGEFRLWLGQVCFIITGGAW